MKLTGISDEAGDSLETQLKATKELGWDTIEARFLKVGSFDKGSIHEIPQEAFDLTVGIIEDSGIGVCGFGSTIGNWAHSIDDDFQITLDEIGRCIPRMERLGTKIVRIMSYAISMDDDKNDLEDQRAPERFRRMREIKQRFDDAGITPVHENCMNYGGMGPSYAQELMNEVPGLKWVYDSGNPVFNRDRSKPEPHPMQDSWEMYELLKAETIHVHIKDGIWNPERKDCDFTYPGKGDGQVEKILSDLKASGYDGYLSIEPHVAAVFHDEPDEGADKEELARNQYDSYVKYGRDLEALIAGLA